MANTVRDGLMARLSDCRHNFVSDGMTNTRAFNGTSHNMIAVVMF